MTDQEFEKCLEKRTKKTVVRDIKIGCNGSDMQHYIPDYTESGLEIPEIHGVNPFYMAIPKPVLLKMLRDLIKDPDVIEDLRKIEKGE